MFSGRWILGDTYKGSVLGCYVDPSAGGNNRFDAGLIQPRRWIYYPVSMLKWVVVLFLAACTTLRPEYFPDAPRYSAVSASDVVVYTREENLPKGFEPIALVKVGGFPVGQRVGVIVAALRREAGSVGANAVVFPELDSADLWSFDPRDVDEEGKREPKVFTALAVRIPGCPRH